MPPDKAFAESVPPTLLGPGVLVLTLIAVVLVFLVSRKFILGVLMFGIFLLPVGQTLMLGTLHLYVTRILILTGLGRAIASRRSHTSFFGGGYNYIDKLFICGVMFQAVAIVLVNPEFSTVVNQMGALWDIIGGYFLMRLLILDDEDVHRGIKSFCGIAAILSVSMLYEKFNYVNLFGLIAGHPIVPEIRNGSIRAQGPFHHAILAGTFGATLLPLFFWLWKTGKSKFLGVIGIFASTAIAFSAASTTPVSAYLAAILGLCFWPLRKSMRAVRWGIAIGVLSLNLVMHAPVWWAVEHIDLAGGSAGQHRAELIDNFVRHFSDWWLIGTKDYGSWGFLMSDISNQYVAIGETGGLISFVCFIAMITLGFKRIGIARKSVEGNRMKEWYFWILGAALFSHSVAFLGISYFDQTQFSWYALLGVIIAATAPILAAQPVSEQQALVATPRPQLGYLAPSLSKQARKETAN